MSLPSHLPKLLMLATAGLQGLGMYLLYRSFDEGLWPSQSPMWFYPMISLVLLLPTGFLLTVERSRERATLLRVGAYGIVSGCWAPISAIRQCPLVRFGSMGYRQPMR